MPNTGKSGKSASFMRVENVLLRRTTSMEKKFFVGRNYLGFMNIYEERTLPVKFMKKKNRSK